MLAGQQPLPVQKPVMVKKTIRDPKTGMLRTIWINPITGQEVQNPEMYQAQPNSPYAGQYGSFGGVMAPNDLLNSDDEEEGITLSDLVDEQNSNTRELTNTGGSGDSGDASFGMADGEAEGRSADNNFGYQNPADNPALANIAMSMIPGAPLMFSVAQTVNNQQAIAAAQEALGIAPNNAVDALGNAVSPSTMEGVIGDISDATGKATVSFSGALPAETNGLLGMFTDDVTAENPVLSLEEALFITQNPEVTIQSYLDNQKAIEMNMQYAPEVVDPVYADLVSPNAAPNYGLDAVDFADVVDNTAEALGMNTDTARGEAEASAITNENLSMFDDNDDGKISQAELDNYNDFIGVDDNESFFGAVGEALSNFANDVADFFGFGEDSADAATDDSFSSMAESFDNASFDSISASNPGGDGGNTSSSSTSSPSSGSGMSPAAAGETDGDSGSDSSGNSNGDTDGVGP